MNYKHQGLSGLPHYGETEICQLICGPQNGKTCVDFRHFKSILNPGFEDMLV